MRRPWAAGGLVLVLGAWTALGGAEGAAPRQPDRQELQEKLEQARRARQELDEAITRATEALRKTGPAEPRYVPSFGPDAPEQKRPIRIALGRGRVLIAAEGLEVRPDGRVGMTTFSAILWWPNEGNDSAFAYSRISVRAARACLKFDGPITASHDMGKRKLLSMGLTGPVSCAGPDGDFRCGALKLWLRDRAGALRIMHLEASENVVARSPALNVCNASRLTLWFKDVEGPVKGARDEAAVAAPINLEARTVEAWVLRSPLKSTPERLRAEGQVHVHQEAAKADEKATDITGDELEMTGNPDGNLLVVRGDLAQLRKDKIYIIGPEVNIDQATNKSWVYGPGAMQMESNTNFQGAALKKAVPLTVHWNEKMFFNGDSAELHGGIQAEQENARLTCQRLEITFDRSISLKSRAKAGEPPARVRTLVCDRDVCIEERVMADGKEIKRNKILSPAVVVQALEAEEAPRQGPDGESNVMVSSGPGVVRVWDKRGRMKLTHVTFGKRMDANSRKNTAHFWEDVRFYSVPSDTPDLKVDLDVVLATTLPEGAMYLRCDRLKLLDRKENGKSNQQMEAHGKVYVQGRDFYARADSVFYDQAKNQIILDSPESGQAMLYPFCGPSAPYDVNTGRKIIYDITTGTSKVEGATPAP